MSDGLQTTHGKAWHSRARPDHCKGIADRREPSTRALPALPALWLAGDVKLRFDQARERHVREVWQSVNTDPGTEHESAADLLGEWRAAERDSVAARTAATVAALAVATAGAAERAAGEAAIAGEAAMEAARRAKEAAEHARKAATQAADAARLTHGTAEGDQARAYEAVANAEQAETEARDRFHEAERAGFPKHPK